MTYDLPLPAKEVEEILSTLNKEQREFIEQTLIQSKKSKWLEVLAKKKGIVITKNMHIEQIEDTVDDWMLLDIKDGGYMQRPYRCECGHTLRFQYIVYHKSKDKKYRLGETCFENYTNLTPEVLRDIKQEFYHIDLERDEILLKFRKREYFSIKPYLKLDLPEEIIGQVELKLPLTNKQITKIESLSLKYEEEIRQIEFKERLCRIEGNLSLEQREFLHTQYSENEQLEILTKVGGYEKTYDLDYLIQLGIEESILNHIRVGLPLLESQSRSIDRMRYLKDKEKSKVARREHRVFGTIKAKEEIGYDTIIEKHLDQLDLIRQNERRIPSELIKDWNYIIQTEKDAKSKKEIDYRIFMLKLNNLLAALGIY